VKSSDRGARAVDYLIYENNGGRLVGTIGFAFAGVRLPGELFAYYQTGQVRAGTPWVAKSRKIAVCFRYTLVKGMPKNFASKALAASIRLLRKEWQNKYDAKLVGVFTFIMPPWTGSCFKACNFEMLGTTSGDPNMKHSSADHKTVLMGEKQLLVLAYRYDIPRDFRSDFNEDAELSLILRRLNRKGKS